MSNRRTFLKNSAALVLGGMVLNIPARGMSLFKPNLPAPGLQLYTVAAKMEEDVEGTLQAVAKIGYKNLESAASKKGSFYGLKATEFAQKVKGMGMTWQSHHTTGAPYKPRPDADGKPVAAPSPPRQNLRDNYQEIVDNLSAAGVPYLVCSSTPVGTMEEIKQSMEVLVKTGEACKKAGMTFAFHNHAREFEMVEGTTAMEMFLTQIPADIMKIELDLGWAVKAGADPVAMFKKNPGRFPLWHVKDLDKDQKPAEVGTGSVDFKRIFASADTAGLKYYFVEQDAAPQPMDNITNSINNLKKIVAVN